MCSTGWCHKSSLAFLSLIRFLFAPALQLETEGGSRFLRDLIPGPLRPTYLRRSIYSHCSMRMWPTPHESAQGPDPQTEVHEHPCRWDEPPALRCGEVPPSGYLLPCAVPAVPP